MIGSLKACVVKAILICRMAREHSGDVEDNGGFLVC